VVAKAPDPGAAVRPPRVEADDVEPPPPDRVQFVLRAGDEVEAALPRAAGTGKQRSDPPAGATREVAGDFQLDLAPVRVRPVQRDGNVGALQARPAVLPINAWCGGGGDLGERRTDADDEQQHRCPESSQNRKIYWKGSLSFSLRKCLLVIVIVALAASLGIAATASADPGPRSSATAGAACEAPRLQTADGCVSRAAARSRIEAIVQGEMARAG
jgi:hypothetical protein